MPKVIHLKTTNWDQLSNKVESTKNSSCNKGTYQRLNFVILGKNFFNSSKQLHLTRWNCPLYWLTFVSLSFREDLDHWNLYSIMNPIIGCMSLFWHLFPYTSTVSNWVSYLMFTISIFFPNCNTFLTYNSYVEWAL